MKKILPWLTASCFLILTSSILRAQDEDVARIAPQKKVNGVDKAIKNLQKRIQDGIDRKVLSDTQAQDLQKQVQDISDLRDQDFKDNGANVLTRGQLKKLQGMVAKASKTVRQAKHGQTDPAKH
jgi:hypothetical protein